MNFPTLPNTIKGLLLIAAGVIVLLDTLGFATQIMHTIVLIGSICTIILGIVLMGLHTKIFGLLKRGSDKKESPIVEEPKQESHPEQKDDDQFRM